MTGFVFAAATFVYVLSAVIYSRASAMAETMFGRALVAVQVVLALALAALAFDCRHETAWIWLAYSGVSVASRARAMALSLKSGVVARGLARQFIKTGNSDITTL